MFKRIVCNIQTGDRRVPNGNGCAKQGKCLFSLSLLEFYEKCPIVRGKQCESNSVNLTERTRQNDAEVRCRRPHVSKGGTLNKNVPPFMFS